MEAVIATTTTTTKVVITAPRHLFCLIFFYLCENERKSNIEVCYKFLCQVFSYKNTFSPSFNVAETLFVFI